MLNFSLPARFIFFCTGFARVVLGCAMKFCFLPRGLGECRTVVKYVRSLWGCYLLHATEFSNLNPKSQRDTKTLNCLNLNNHGLSPVLHGFLEHLGTESPAHPGHD